MGLMAICAVLCMLMLGYFEPEMFEPASAGSKSHSVVWVSANEKTIAWDAVSTLVSNEPIPAEDMIEYEVYIVDAVADPNKLTPTLMGRTADTEFRISLEHEGKYWCGVRTVRTPAVAPNTQTRSTIGWSDDPLICKDGQAFGILFFLAPSGIHGLTA